MNSIVNQVAERLASDAGVQWSAVSEGDRSHWREQVRATLRTLGDVSNSMKREQFSKYDGLGPLENVWRSILYEMIENGR